MSALPLDITVEMTYVVSGPAEILMQIEPTDGHGQSILTSNLNLEGVERLVTTPAQEDIGNHSRFFVVKELQSKFFFVHNNALLTDYHISIINCFGYFFDNFVTLRTFYFFFRINYFIP